MIALLRASTIALLLSLGTPAASFEPELPPGARLTAERESALDVFDAPEGVFDGVRVPSLSVEGRILRRAWRIDTGGLTPLQVIAPLRSQLAEQGYDIAFECAAVTCGGFDFRFHTEVLPGPNMYVNLSRFFYLTATRRGASAGQEVVGLLASVTVASAYLQIISAQPVSPGPVASQPAVERVSPGTAEPEAPSVADGVLSFEARLMTDGRIVLPDLSFDSGTSDLSEGSYSSLRDLAAVLERRPGLRIALVGHTDSVGALEANITLSRARARAVRDRLISEYGVDGTRLDAEGMGYLAPIATNLTEEGRLRNRRVEAILLSEN